MVIGGANSLSENLSCFSFLSYKDKIIGIQIPTQIPYSDEIFNVYISDEIFGYLELENSTITAFDCLENENKTYDVYIKDSEVFEDFLNSTDMVKSLNEKLSNKEIQIKGASFTKKVKMFFTKLGLKIMGWFS